MAWKVCCIFPSPILWLLSWIPRGRTQLDMQICQHWSDELSPRYLSWNADVILAQETRITQNNFNILQQDAQQQGKQIFPRAFLHEERDSKGHLRTPHGGCACLANPTISIPFRSSDDETGVWDTLKDSARVAAVWIQKLYASLSMVIPTFQMVKITK